MSDLRKLQMDLGLIRSRNGKLKQLDFYIKN
jgi:hypothetical protein